MENNEMTNDSNAPMTEYRAEISIKSYVADMVPKWLRGTRRLDESETIIRNVRFPDGNVFEVKLCGGDLAWAEAALYGPNGSVLEYTEPSESFFGEWTIEHGGVRYVVNVVAESGRKPRT